MGTLIGALGEVQSVVAQKSAPIAELLAQEKERREQLRRWFETVDADNRWLLSMGWPTLMHGPLNAASHLRARCKSLSPNAGRKAVDKAIIAYYSEDRIRTHILTKWENNSFLKRRIAILRSAVDAHIRRDYALSVPAILAQTEGLVADYFGYRGQVQWNRVKSHVEQLLTDGGVSKWNDLYRQFVSNVVLRGFVHGKPVRDLNRHAILHGADIDYATAAKSLKAILILDFLLSHVYLVSVGSHKTYHRPECARIRRCNEVRKVIRFQVVAQFYGLTPCKSCRPDTLGP